MHTTVLLTGWDTTLIMAPLFGLLVFWRFGLDERVTASKARPTRRHFCEPDGPDGNPACSDPDGKPWRMRRRVILPCRKAPVVVEILPPESSEQAWRSRRNRSMHQKLNRLA